MQKYLGSIFTDKKGYGLNQYNVEVDEILSRVRLDECERNIFMPSEARLENFFKK